MRPIFYWKCNELDYESTTKTNILDYSSGNFHLSFNDYLSYYKKNKPIFYYDSTPPASFKEINDSIPIRGIQCKKTASYKIEDISKLAIGDTQENYSSQNISFNVFDFSTIIAKKNDYKSFTVHLIISDCYKVAKNNSNDCNTTYYSKIIDIGPLRLCIATDYGPVGNCIELRTYFVAFLAVDLKLHYKSNDEYSYTTCYGIQIWKSPVVSDFSLFNQIILSTEYLIDNKIDVYVRFNGEKVTENGGYDNQVEKWTISFDDYQIDYNTQYVGYPTIETNIYSYKYRTIIYGNRSQIAEYGVTLANIALYESTLADINWFSENTIDKLTTLYEPLENTIAHQYLQESCPLIFSHKEPFSLIGTLDTVLTQGTDQRFFKKIKVNGSNITLDFLDSNDYEFINDRCFLVNKFRDDDYIEIEGSSQQFDSYYKIISSTNHSITFTDTNFTDETGNFIVKKLPIGNWKKIQGTENTDDEVWYQSRNPRESNQYLIIRDIFGKYAEVCLYNETEDLKSNLLYWKKNFKSDYLYDKNIVRWRIVGDDKRIYLMLPHWNSSSHFGIILCYGEIQDLSTNNWNTILIGYFDNIIGKLAENQLTFYNNYSILTTGHLMAKKYTPIFTNRYASYIMSVDDSYDNFYINYDIARFIYPDPDFSDSY